MVIYNITYFNLLRCLITLIYQIKIYIFNLVYICIDIDFIYQVSSWCLKSLLFKCETLRDLVCIDFFYKKKRFSLFYNYLNYAYNIGFFFFGNISIYFDMPYTSGVSSLSFLYNSAGWLEREVWDLFGIFFINHFDLRRLLTDYGFIGFPLRKEFPLIGYKDNRYDDFNHVILYENIQQITQNYRMYEYTNTFFK